MSRCLARRCPLYGTIENEGMCSQHGNDPTLKPIPSRHLSEAESLDALGWTAEEVFPTLEEFEERLLWMRTTRQLPILGSDNSVSVQAATEFIGIPDTQCLSVDMAMRIWTEVVMPRGLNPLAFQKALVHRTLANWILPSRDFGVGKCYFGHFDNGPTQAKHVHHFVPLRYREPPPPRPSRIVKAWEAAQDWVRRFWDQLWE